MSINALTPAGGPLTMTSLELVEFINAHRKELAEVAGVPFPSAGYAELRHDSFMSKVPEVLGKEAAPKFLGAAFYAVARAIVRRGRAFFGLPHARMAPGRCRDGRQPDQAA